MTLPVFDLSLAPPGKLTMPSVAGGAVEGGRTMSGLVVAADMTGGGLVTVKYSSVQLRNSTPDALRYWSRLGGMLNSGVRSIIVPMLVDYIQPVAAPLFPRAPSMSGGIVFAPPAADNSDTFGADAALNAATVTLRIGSRSLVGGQWFEVVHPTKLNRIYVVTDIDSVTTADDGSQTVVIGIRPPLREAVSAGAAINFDQPKCVMRLAPGTTITADVTGFWTATPDVAFIESMGPFA